MLNPFQAGKVVFLGAWGPFPLLWGHAWEDALVSWGGQVDLLPRGWQLVNSWHRIPCQQWKLLPSFPFLHSTTLLLLSCSMPELMLPRLWELALGHGFTQGCGTHRCVTHLHVCGCSESGAECQDKYRLHRGIKLVWFVFGLEIQSHLFQMFPVVFIARSYCAALQEKII